MNPGAEHWQANPCATKCQRLEAKRRQGWVSCSSLSSMRAQLAMFTAAVMQAVIGVDRIARRQVQSTVRTDNHIFRLAQTLFRCSWGHGIAAVFAPDVKGHQNNQGDQ